MMSTMPTFVQHRVIWHRNPNMMTTHAYIDGAGQLEESICGMALYAVNYDSEWYYTPRCITCVGLAPFDTYIENTTNNRKQTNMTPRKPAATKAAPAKKLTPTQKAAEDRQVLFDYLSEVLDPSDIKSINKKLHTPLPLEVEKKEFYNFYINIDTDLKWTDAAYEADTEDWYDAPELIEEATFMKHLEKALQQAVKSYQPKQGTLSFKRLGVTLEEYQAQDI